MAVAKLVIEHHGRRQPNWGSGDWQLTWDGLTVVYDWPASDDPSLAVVVTAWEE